MEPGLSSPQEHVLRGGRPTVWQKEIWAFDGESSSVLTSLGKVNKDAARYMYDIPTIETENLKLRAAEWRDFDAYTAFQESPRSQTVGGPYSRIEAYTMFAELLGHWRLRGFGRWLVADKSSDEPLGIIGLHYPVGWPEAEIGWTVFESAEGRGIAYEAAIASRRYAYEKLGWTRIVSMIGPTNVRSIALAERLGCTYEGDYEHEAYGTLKRYRHLAPDEL